MVVTITYETLFDILRRERNREELQALEPTFYADVLSYLAQKQALLEQFSRSDGLYATAEGEKARIQFHNIRKILRELYDRREKKIVLLALNASRTGSVVSVEGFLDQERMLFEQVKTLFSRHRSSMLDLVLSRVASVPLEAAPLPLAPQDSDEVHVRFLKAVPRFAGEDVVFGPFSDGDEASLPSKIADVLVRKGRAQKV